MKKNTWLSKPITWGGYLKLVGVSMVASAICTAYAWWKMGLFEFLTGVRNRKRIYLKKKMKTT